LTPCWYVCDVSTLAKTVRERTGLFPALVFGSAIHGAGRTFLAKMVEKIFDRAGYPVERISVGSIFREIAAKEGLSVDEFAALEAKDPERFYALNQEIDEEVHERMGSAAEDAVVVIDSNIAAYHADTDNVYAFLVYADPRIIAKRVLAHPRAGDSQYHSEKEAMRALLQRTREDIEMYSRMSTVAKGNFWKMVYRIAAEDMQKNLNALLDGNVPKSPFYHASIDNNGAEEQTMEKWCDAVQKIVNLL